MRSLIVLALFVGCALALPDIPRGFPQKLARNRVQNLKNVVPAGIPQRLARERVQNLKNIVPAGLPQKLARERVQNLKSVVPAGLPQRLARERVQNLKNIVPAGLPQRLARERVEKLKFPVAVEALSPEGCNRICTADYRPLCATNGVTYANRCTMDFEVCSKRLSIAVAHEGRC